MRKFHSVRTGPMSVRTLVRTLSVIAVSAVVAACSSGAAPTPSGAALPPSGAAPTPSGAGQSAASLAGTTITFITPTTPEETIMKELAPVFTQQTGITVNFVELESKDERAKVNTDLSQNGGQFDVVTMGPFEVTDWAKAGSMVALDSYAAKDPKYDLADFIPSVMKLLTFNGSTYAIPFYGESSMMFYNKDMFAAAGVTMPDKPTWADIANLASKLTDRSKGQDGICMRGVPGWGDNMAAITTVVNTFGGQWFDMNWNPTIDTPEWRQALTAYANLVQKYGPAGPGTVGYDTCLLLMSQGHAAMWYDATVSASTLEDSSQSKIAGHVGYAWAPVASAGGAPSGWLYSWAMGIPKTSKHQDAAWAFLDWVTSKDYVNLVASKKGFIHVPPGARASTYALADYVKAAPFATITLDSIQSTNPDHPTKSPVPYTGVQYVAIPEFQELGDYVGNQMTAYLAGTESLDTALKNSQAKALEISKSGGYLK